MQELAYRLIAQARGASTDDSTTDDSPVDLPLSGGEARLRVGLWPIVSAEAPEAAMGLMTALGTLLQQRDGTLAYRLVARMEEGDESLPWNVGQSQFDVDDWQLEGLDENVAVWGQLSRQGEGWQLSLRAENDLAEEEEGVLAFNYTAPTMAALVGQLPDIADELATALGAGRDDPLAPIYDMDDVQSPAVEPLLAQAFHWEKQLYRWLADADWSDAEIDADFAALLDAGRTAGGEFGAWVVANGMARALLPVSREVGERTLARISEVVRAFPDNAIAAMVLAPALIGADRSQDAIDLLTAAVEAQPGNPQARLILAEAYRRASRVTDMIDTLQRAIVDGAASVPLMMVYGGLLSALRDSGLVAPQFVLIDAPDRQLARMAEEAIAAYDAVLDDQPAHLDAMQRRLLLDIERGSDGVWEEFARLIDADESGERVRAVVDTFQSLDNISEGLDALDQAVTRKPQRHDLKVSYAVALLAADEPDEALEQLEAAAEYMQDVSSAAEIQRLMLAASDPEFEFRLGEITEQLDANKSISNSDLEFLEEVIESAPYVAQGYLLLARSYLSRQDAAAALETLLDGQSTLPDDPEIVELLARVLWQSDERDLAFDHLNKALSTNPDHVPLLALTGQFLFEEDQPDEARIFLTRAESLNPRSRALLEAKRNIARMLDD